MAASGIRPKANVNAPQLAESPPKLKPARMLSLIEPFFSARTKKKKAAIIRNIPRASLSKNPAIVLLM